MGDKGRFPNYFLQSVLEEIVKEKRLVNTQIKIESGSSKGDNYVGVIYRVKVEGQRASDQGNELRQDTLNLIFKCLPELEARRVQMGSRVYFNNEVNFYNKVLPGFLAFQRDRGVRGEDTFSCTAKCYRALNNEVMEGAEEELIVMEDMREEGYVMRDRRAGLDAAHCHLVLQQLAKLHAFSFAMRDQKPEQFNKLKNSIAETLYINPPKDGFLDFISGYQSHIEEAVMSQVPGDSIYKQRACNFMHNYYDIMVKCVDGKTAEPYAVICHGDCWTNNILFKYTKNDSKPTSIILLDFQLSRYASPVLDLAYFIMCCTDQSLRKEHYSHLLTRYYDRLAHFIRLLGSDPEKLFPLHVFKEHVKKYSKFGFGMAVITVPLFTSISDNIPDLDEVYNEDSKSSNKMWTSTMKDNLLCQERMGDLIIDMVDLGYM